MSWGHSECGTWSGRTFHGALLTELLYQWGWGCWRGAHLLTDSSCVHVSSAFPVWLLPPPSNSPASLYLLFSGNCPPVGESQSPSGQSSAPAPPPRLNPSASSPNFFKYLKHNPSGEQSGNAVPKRWAACMASSVSLVFPGWSRREGVLHVHTGPRGHRARACVCVCVCVLVWLCFSNFQSIIWIHLILPLINSLKIVMKTILRARCDTSFHIPLLWCVYTHTHTFNGNVLDYISCNLCHFRNFLINLIKLFFYFEKKESLWMMDWILLLGFCFYLVRMLKMRSILNTFFMYSHITNCMGTAL